MPLPIKSSGENIVVWGTCFVAYYSTLQWRKSWSLPWLLACFCCDFCTNQPTPKVRHIHHYALKQFAHIWIIPNSTQCMKIFFFYGYLDSSWTCNIWESSYEFCLLWGTKVAFGSVSGYYIRKQPRWPLLWSTRSSSISTILTKALLKSALSFLTLTASQIWINTSIISLFLVQRACEMHCGLGSGGL